MKKSTISILVALFGGSWITGYMMAHGIIGDGFFISMFVLIISIIVVGTIVTMIIGDD